MLKRSIFRANKNFIRNNIPFIESCSGQPPLFLSCDKCLQPTSTPNKTIEYQLVIENSEFGVIRWKGGETTVFKEM